MTRILRAALSWIQQTREEGLAILRPALVITRREIHDTLRDWRILIPIGLLTTVFPFLANYAAGEGLNFVNQYGAELIMTRLFPFLMLVVGFFPSSFSLVIALEAFVGEKERRSLEPLLATPLTDSQLYLGKLLSCTLTPVVASYLAILFYMLLVGFSVGWWPSLSLFAVTLVLSTAQALVMVSAAVVVSAQATSARAANLVASFIIIPIAFLLQGEASLLLFGDYMVLWLIAFFLLITDVLFVRMGVRVFNREQLLGRSLDHLDLHAAWRTFWRAMWPAQGLVHLYTRQLPKHLRRLWPELLFTVLVVFGGGTLVGWWGSVQLPLPLEAVDLPELASTEDFDAAVEALGLLPAFSTEAILWNNLRSLFFAALLAIFSLGTVAELLLMAPWAIVAYAFFEIPKLGLDPWRFILVSIVPHGVLELPAAVIATAQAMRMGITILQDPAEGGGVMGILRELGYFIQLFIVLILPLLALAAWIEAQVTPQLLISMLQDLY